MRGRRLTRCSICGLNPGLCLCEALPQLTPRTRIHVVAHRKELFKSTNSSRLAVRMLQGASLCSRADPRVSAATDGEHNDPLPSTAGTWVLFPSPAAIPLAHARSLGVQALIVPDGTWTQAKRIARRDRSCRGLPHVCLQTDRPSLYQLRRNAREAGLCTFEAIAEALRVLEGDALADALLATFTEWVARARKVRAGAHEEALLGSQSGLR